MGIAGSPVSNMVVQWGSQRTTFFTWAFANASINFLRKLHEQVLVARAPRRLTAAGFTRQHAPGDGGGIENLLHGRGNCLAVLIETQSAAQPEEPFLAAVENGELLRGSKRFCRVSCVAPQGLWGARSMVVNSSATFSLLDASFADQPAPQIQSFPSHMFDAHRTDKLAGAAGETLEEVLFRNVDFPLRFSSAVPATRSPPLSRPFCRSRMTSFGLSDPPARLAGQNCVQRPHSTQALTSRMSLRP